MIYNKDAVFPYPILCRTSNSYKESYFDFSVDEVSETDSSYVFSFSYEIGSSFINKLIEEEKAAVILIIQDGDNFFARLEKGQRKIELGKNRLSLVKRTKIQLHVQALEAINFSEAEDLNEFYDQYKEEIHIKRNSLLGYSDESTLEGNEAKPLDIFEQSIKDNLSVPFKVELHSETIKLVFRDRKESLDSLNVKKSMRNMYLYIGLNRALTSFVESYGKDEQFVAIASIVPENGLDEKLKDLMQSKGIDEISLEDLDETIQKMSDGIIEKYTDSIKEMAENGN